MKKVIVFLSVVVLGAAIWYFFLKSHDYQVNFKAKTFPGAINQIIKAWGKTQESATFLGQKSISELTQQHTFGDSTHIYHWKITPIHDSLSQVSVYARDKDHSFQNKLRIPFSDTDFEKRARKTVLDFGKELTEHIKNFKVKVLGEEEIPASFCACTNVKSTQFGKANGMMRDYPLLTDFLSKNNIAWNGSPFIEVTKWEKGKDSLVFKFCFPIIQSEILPEHPEINYQKFYGKKALKAIYNGNYITSDRAWYALLDYAERQKIEVSGLPVEIFFNNPNMGGSGIDWKAEVYMPLKTIADE